MLRVKDIKKEYSNKIVLDGINLEVDKGQIYGLVGKNGAGKTTLMKIISGITKPSSGECLLEGAILNKNALENGSVGYLPDVPAFYDYMSVEEFLTFLYQAKSNTMPINLSDHTFSVESIIDRLNLEPKTRIKKLSRGNKQKLGIGSALIGNPRILLLDEPTSALDPLGRNDVFELIYELKKEGLSIIFSTHILTDIEKICDKIGFLHNGVIARELNLNEANDISTGIVIQFDHLSDLKQDIISSVFDGCSYIIKHNSVCVMFSDHYSISDQQNLYSRISLLPYKVLKVEPFIQNNIEDIMNEVLS